MIPPLVGKFVGGETPDVALEHVETLNRNDVGGILNLLGEHYHDPKNVESDAASYLELIETIDASGADACISVKPSQIGLDISDDLFEEKLTEIADHGAEHDVFVWVDMEDYTTTDATLDAYEPLVRRHDGGMGVCLQSNLKRTREDLERLADAPGKVRLVKGAYDEPESVAYKRKERVNERYRRDLEFMFDQYDDGIGVGSHDPEFVAYARELHREYGTPYEVQMLMGVRQDAQYDLAARGVSVYQYIPFGEKWMSYFYRRVRERKENALFAIRALVS